MAEAISPLAVLASHVISSPSLTSHVMLLLAAVSFCLARIVHEAAAAPVVGAA